MSLIKKSLNKIIDRQISPEIKRIIADLRQHQNEFGVDSFGFQPSYLRFVLPFVQLIYKHYFRTEVFGIENVPDEGRVFLVANHSGQIPVDGAMIVSSCLIDKKPPRMVRSMVEKWVPTLPYVNIFMFRSGQVVGTPENCRQLLAREESILVFPEGIGGISKTFKDRYKLQEFGYGFMRLALETGTPIVPVAVIGAEEQFPALYNAKKLAKLLKAPSFPITPTFPWLLPAGLLPYPTKYRIHFGKPMKFSGSPNEVDRVMRLKVGKVKQVLQEMLNEGVKQRKAIFW